MPNLRVMIKKSTSPYPNPSSDILNIENTSRKDIIDVSIYLVNGMKVKHSTNGNQIQVSDLKSGICIVKVEINNQVLATSSSKYIVPIIKKGLEYITAYSKPFLYIINRYFFLFLYLHILKKQLDILIRVCKCFFNLIRIKPGNFFYAFLKLAE